MKILHLISSGGLYGAENVVLSLSQYFNRKGIETWIGALRNTKNPNLELIERAQEEGIPTYVLQNEGRLDAMAVWRLRQFIIENKITILHTHNYKSDLIGFVTARICNIPTVGTAHGFTGMNHVVSLYEKIDRMILRTGYDRVIVVTDRMFKNCPQEKRRVIPNGLDIRRFQSDPKKRMEFRAQWKLSADDFVVGQIGRLSREKNQILLLKAAEILLPKNPHLKFLIVGGGPEEKTLKEFVRKKNLESKIILTGIIKKMPVVYQAVDLFVLPSLTEGIPLTVLESMAARVPMIASNVGGVPDLIEDGKTGVLMQSVTVEELVNKIDLLTKDPTQRKHLAKAAYEFIADAYGIEPMCRAYEAIYRELSLGK